MPVGIDIIEIERVERALERRPRLAERLFSSAELEFARSRRRPGRHLAARFAAKEAALKTLGDRGISPREIEVEGGGGERPRLALHGAAASAASREGLELDLSLSHSRELAVALVSAQPRAGER